MGRNKPQAESSRADVTSRANRRAFLASVGAVSAFGLAGCTGNGDDDSGGSDDGGNGNGGGDDFPSENIRLVVPFGPGGGTDIYARHFAPETSQYIDTTIAIDNIEGAGGALGLTDAYNSDPDGHTLGFGVPPGTSMLGYVAAPENFDIEYENFEPVGIMGLNTNVVMANPDLGIDYQDAVDMYQSGDLTTIGAHQHGQATHVASVVARENHGLAWEEYVSYDGSGDIAQAVASGEIPVGLVSEPAAVPFMEDGSVDIIADVSSYGGITTELPSVTDYGFDDMDYLVLSRAWLAPPGTPEEPRQIIAEALEEACNSEATAEWAEDTGNDVTFGGIEECRESWHGALEAIPEAVDIDMLREEMGI
ncbi:Bug family tripartite tricarboxylate transporter substrate binding protein [Natronobiforma cellulositropha]|uniref:Bug family tripartite tricarboxylate transporter substrate binding protein n=1 Tax=Natronobiforma cellulositropha TaxID=1679076 RepID=UPI0021D58F39|nr:tripartite tricarboxylate transporter substrate-binding protein [Natronobiforma cellulositropha]